MKDMPGKLKPRVVKGIFGLHSVSPGPLHCGSVCQRKGSLCLADVLNVHDSLLGLVIIGV